MKYELFSVGNGHTLVSYSDGKMDIIPDEKLVELPANSLIDDNQSNTTYFNDLISKMIKEYSQARESGTSISGERVYIQVINEKVDWSAEGVDYFGEYNVVGCNSYEPISIQKINVEGLLPAWKNINIIYQALLQIWFSGCHATVNDEHNFKIAMERRHQ